MIMPRNRVVVSLLALILCLVIILGVYRPEYLPYNLRAPVTACPEPTYQKLPATTDEDKTLPASKEEERKLPATNDEERNVNTTPKFDKWALKNKVHGLNLDFELTKSELENIGPANASHFIGLDSRKVHARFPGITFMPLYQREQYVLPEPRRGKERNLTELGEYESEDRFFSLFRTKHIHCADVERMGREGDGGWDVCVSEPYKPTVGDCLVYSFGINNDFSFDDAIAERYNCTVNAYDPSMKVESHWHTPKVWFSNVGLSENDEIHKRHGWKMYSMGSLVNMAGHQNRTIDVLKMDIESSEWASFKAMFRQGTLNRVKQLCFEIHVNAGGDLVKVRERFSDMAYTLLNLEQLGFRRFHWHTNPIPHMRLSGRTGKRRACCYELYYINVNFIRNALTNPIKT